MKFIPVDTLPKKSPRRCGKPSEDYLGDFLNMEVKYARMDISELDYAHPFAAYTSIVNSIKRHALPIEARFISGEVYLVNLELED